MKNITRNISSILASLILFAGVPLLYAWTGPTAVPPQGNTSGPVTVGSASQNKAGVLGLGGLAVFGKSLFSATSGYSLPSGNADMLVGVNGSIGAKKYCDENGQNCVTTLGGSSAVSYPSSNPNKAARANLVRAVGVSLPVPAGMTEWPDTLICTASPGQNYIFDFYGVGDKTVAYWTQDKTGMFFNLDGTINTAQPLRNDPKCGSGAKNIKEFCDQGRCIQ